MISDIQYLHVKLEKQHNLCLTESAAPYFSCSLIQADAERERERARGREERERERGGERERERGGGEEREREKGSR